MSETVEAVQSQQETPESVNIQALEALVFGEPIPQNAVPNTSPEIPAEGQGAANTDTVATPAPAATVTEDNIVDEIEYLKQQVGYDNWDTLKSDIASLKELREKAQTPAEIKFANDEARRWFEYFKEGKEEELYNSLSGRRMLKDVESMGDEQRLKLYIKMQNPLFDQELIDYTFDNNYRLNEEDYADDPMKLRFEKTSRLQRMQNDLRSANEHFAQYKSKIELPDIQKQLTQQEPVVDNDYVSYKASIAKEAELYNNIIKPALTSLKESDLQMNVAVNDANNQMQFDVGISVEPNDLKAVMSKALNFNEYLNEVSSDGSGKFAPQRIARMILLEQNFDKFAQSIARQAVNAERKRVIEKESAGGGIQRTYTPMEGKTEVQQHADMAFSV